VRWEQRTEDRCPGSPKKEDWKIQIQAGLPIGSDRATLNGVYLDPLAGKKEKRKRSHSTGVWGWYWTLISAWFLRYRISILSFCRSEQQTLHVSPDDWSTYVGWFWGFFSSGSVSFTFCQLIVFIWGFRGKMLAKFAAFKEPKWSLLSMVICSSVHNSTEPHGLVGLVQQPRH